MPDHALLTAETHRDLRIRTDRGVALGDGVMAIAAMPDEFRRIQDEYPIVFRQTADFDGFMPFALFGFEQGENLFLDGDRWTGGYLPMALDIQPFLIGQAAAGSADKQVHVDLASPRVAAPGGEGVRVFDEFGRATPYLEQIAERLGALDAAYGALSGFMAALRRHELLEPFTLEVTLDDGATNRLVGFHVIDEDRLAALDGAALGDLHGEGHLLPVFMALASLGNLQKLIDRKNRQAPNG